MGRRGPVARACSIVHVFFLVAVLRVGVLAACDIRAMLTRSCIRDVELLGIPSSPHNFNNVAAGFEPFERTSAVAPPLYFILLANASPSPPLPFDQPPTSLLFFLRFKVLE